MHTPALLLLWFRVVQFFKTNISQVSVVTSYGISKIHKCLTGRAPAYLAESCRQAGTRRPGMRSAGTSMRDVPRTRTALCARSFAVASPRVWNSLPAGIRDPTLSAGTFATLLKTYLFV